MIGSLQAFLAVMKTVISSRLAYRGDLFLSMFVTLLGEAVLPFMTLLIYHTGASFPGWGLKEALLIQAVFLLARGLAYPFFFGIVYNTLDRVRDGSFDILLLKPRSALFMTLVTGFSLDGIGRIIGGAILFGYALNGIPAPSGLDWLGFALLLFFSAGILFASSLFMSGLLFVWVGMSRVYEMHDAVTSFGQYPRSVFRKPLRMFLSAVLPVMMIAYYPAAALLHRYDAAMFGAGAASLVFVAAGLLFWNVMMSKYTSAGG